MANEPQANENFAAVNFKQPDANAQPEVQPKVEPAVKPEVPEAPQENLAELFDRVAPEGFEGSPVAPVGEPAPQERIPQPERAPQRQGEPFNGYGPNITAKQREIEELEAKMEKFNAEDSPYIVDDGQGGKQYDFASFTKDQMVWQKHNRELQDLKDRARERKAAGQDQQRIAYQVAGAVLQERLGSSRMPKPMKDGIVKLYRKAFDIFSAQSYWGQPMFGDRNKLRAAVTQMLDTCVGQVAQQQYLGGEVAPSALGYDAGTEEQPAKTTEAAANEDEPFVKQVMAAYNEHHGSYKTIGQLRREQRAAAMSKEQ